MAPFSMPKGGFAMAFIRVKDKDTGHEFDVPETDWRIKAGIFTPVSGKDAVPYPLRAKHRVASKGVTSKPVNKATPKPGSASGSGG